MEKYLDRCLSSLIIDEKHMKAFEALVINDGSKDRTSEIAHLYETKYPETFRCIDKENGHYGSCVNRGLDEAKGIFVKILDADDSLDSTVFREYLDFLSDKDVLSSADAVLSDYIQVDDNLALLSEHKYDSYDSPISLGQVSIEDRCRWFIHGLTYRTENLRIMNHRQTEGIAYTDIEWCYYPSLSITRIFRFEGFLYRYTKQREGQSVQPSIQGRNIEMEISVTETMLSRTPELIKHASPEQISFMNDHLSIQVSHIYQLCLLTLHRYIPEYSRLKQFDIILKESAPGLYDKMDNYRTCIAGIAFKPVRYWRGNRIIRLKAIQSLYSLADWKNNLLNRHRVASN